MIPQAKGEAQASILIIEDDRNMRTMLRHALEKDGYNVMTAADGVRGLQEFKEHAPDIVLMDAVMPKLDGFQACAALRRMPGGDEAPVLMITALNDDTSVDRAFDSGASEYITKPFNWAVLRQRVRRLVRERNAEKCIAYMAFNDSLTGLLNRRKFLERLEYGLAQARRSNTELALMFLDLDGFKLVNDSLGHDVGDELLKMVAERLVACLRESDTVARLGGDEFTAVLTQVTSRDQVERAAERVLESLGKAIDLGDRSVHIGASIGVAMYPEHGADVRTLLRSADMAMYQAKAEGRNNIRFYNQEVGEAVQTRMSMETSIRSALDNDQFTVFYQPIVDLQEQRIRSFEALVRWNHPELGVVSPVDFIPLAEESGLIGPLGLRVLRLACEQAKFWETVIDERVHVAVNLSAKQFSDRHLVSSFRRIFDEVGICPTRLEFELTENTVMHDVDRSVAMLKELKDLGAEISIDDFGTGYSSLAYLKKFPLDCLKVDRSFVSTLPDNTDDCAIVSAVIAVAHSLRLNVVAEGVEERAQMDFLRELGCDRVQGYLLGRPTPATAVPQMLREGLSVLAKPAPILLIGGEKASA